MTNPTPELDPSGQATPAAEEPASGGLFAKIRQTAVDNYNGLYKIVLEPSMPKRYQVYLIIFGAILGLIWAWGLFPAEFSGANPNRMNQAAQDQWVKMIAVAATSGVEYNETIAADLLSRVPNPNDTLQRLINDPATAQDDLKALQNLSAIVSTADIVGAESPAQGGIVASIVQVVSLILLIGILTPIWMLLYRLLIYPNIVAAILDRIKQATNKEYAEQKRRQQQELVIQRQQREMVEQMKHESAAASAELGEPVMQKLAIYAEGRSFDESYEIELPLDKGGDFLGQCGAVVAEAVDPDMVAIEIWLFDMFSQQEIKKVLITEAGNNDPSIRSRVEGAVKDPANDIVVATIGASLGIDSDKLKLQAKVSQVDTNASGRFASFNLQMRAWQKDAASAGTPAPAGGAPAAAVPPPIPPAAPLPDYSDFEFDPPPPMPGQSAAPTQPQQPPAAKPLQPPPMQAPPSPPQSPPDDDPFGGTGDFTPLGN